MKQFLFLTMFCAMFATAIQAQTPQSNITITNNTSCDVYLMLYGKDQSAMSCTGTHSSAFIVIAAMGSVNWDPSTVPGGLNCGSCTPGTLGAPDQFVAADIYDGDITNCSGTVVGTIGENCLSLPGSFGPYSVNEVTMCFSCTEVTATWTNTGGNVNLDFN